MNYSKKKILIVDDEAITAIMEQKQLESYGYMISHVINGKEAIKITLASESSFDLILMDIDLGSGIDGTETAQKILEHIDIPIIFLSSHTEPEIVEKTEKIASYGYVVKGTGIAVLDASIKMAFKLFYANREFQKKEALLQSIVENITDRKQAEKKTMDTELLYQTLFENSPYGIVICELIRDEQNRVFDFLHLNGNKAVSIETGFNLKNIIGKKASEVGSPEEIAEPIRIYEQVVSSGNSATYTQYFSIYNRFIEVTAFHLADDMFIINFINISDRTRAEDKLRESEEKYRCLVDTSSDLIWTIDLEGRHIYCNPAIYQHLGYHADEVIGTSSFPQMHPCSISSEDRSRAVSRSRCRPVSARSTTRLTAPIRESGSPARWRPAPSLTPTPFPLCSIIRPSSKLVPWQTRNGAP